MFIGLGISKTIFGISFHKKCLYIKRYTKHPKTFSFLLFPVLTSSPIIPLFIYSSLPLPAQQTCPQARTDVHIKDTGGK